MANASWKHYVALLRLDKPVGIWLVFFPAAWGVLLASNGLPLALLLVMLAGAVLTRAAGCILNDLTDRKLDATVARTKDRPLAAGTVPVPHAYVLLAALLLLALLLALSLPHAVLWLGFAAVPMFAAYPWMKRITWWPQLFLGFTFNLGALFGWLATGAALAPPAILLYAACICWTLAYDTIYAIQDMEDDKRAGMKSTALLLGEKLPGFVTLCFLAMQGLLIAAGVLSHAGAPFLLGLIAAAFHMRWQLNRLRSAGNGAAGGLFLSNQWLGLILLAGMMVDKLL